MSPIFAACRRFNPSCGERWTRYIEWSGFYHIEEVVSTDFLLCPPLVESLVDSDWEFNVQETNRIFFFRDHAYLKERVQFDASRHNLLALTEVPTHEFEPLAGFTFCGYDILDSDDSLSVLTNCGAFPAIYRPEELNRHGLIGDLVRVAKIAQTIRETHADDHHCRACRVWGIARYSEAA